MVVIVLILMGNKACCNVRDAEYKPVYPSKE